MEDAFKQAMEIVKAQAGVRTMSTEEITSMLRSIASSLQGLSSEETVSDDSSVNPIMEPSKAIKMNSISCLVCGHSFKVLSSHHLASHGLTKAEYMSKFGYKKGTALTCKSLVKVRREKMQSMKIWERRGGTEGNNEGVSGDIANVVPGKPAALEKKASLKAASPTKKSDTIREKKKTSATHKQLEAAEKKDVQGSNKQHDTDVIVRRNEGENN